MLVTVTLTSLSPATGPFNLYQNTDGFAFPVATNVSQAEMLGGYTVTVDDSATIIRVLSVGTCTNYIDLNISGIPSPTPTQTPTPTPTPAPGINKLMTEANDGLQVETGDDIITEQ